MQENLLLSIIIPSFQQGLHLNNALLSISGQNFKNYEILVIDACSTDSTKEVVETFNFLPVHIYQEPDKGVYDAMNKGVSIAKGKWLYFMGCDDRLRDNILDELSAFFINDEVDLLYGDVILSSTNSRYAGAFDLNRLLCESNICHQAIFYKKRVFDKLGFYNLKYRTWADWEFNIRCFRHTELIIRYVNIVIGYYNDELGISNTYDTVLGEEIPLPYINKIKLLEQQQQRILVSKSYLIGNKIVNCLNVIRRIVLNK